MRDWKRPAFVALWLAPAVVFLVVFMYYPIIETFRLSFFKSSGFEQEVFIGLGNYAKLFADAEFLAGLEHVFTWAFWSVAIQIPLAFVIAFSLTYYANKFTGPLKAVFYLSNVLPSAITAMLGKFIFAPRFGIVASLAEQFGWKWLGSIDFLGNPNLAFWSLFFIATWAYTGFPIIYMMAEIEQMPRELREAAELDGATGWRFARSIVLPEIAYPVRILVVLATVGSLKLFDLPNMVTAGGPYNATMTLGIKLYNEGFLKWNYGRAAAVGVVIFLLSLVFTIAQFTRGRKASEAK